MAVVNSIPPPRIDGRCPGLVDGKQCMFAPHHPGSCLHWLEEEAHVPPDGEQVDHPLHYNSHPSGIECITVVEHMNFNVGNAIKYLWRSDHKNGIEDLKKALWYVQREIERLERDVSA